MSVHEWCQDVSRDEAVRAAEDAAAVPAIQHRDLPEQVALLWASVSDILGRVVRLEGEMDAGEVEAVEAVPPPDPAFPGEGMRTERVTLEFHIEGPPPTQWPWSYILNRSDAFKMRPGESVRVVEETRGGRLPDMVAWITAERDAAQAERDAARAEAERLRIRVAELEAARAAGGVAKQEPVACGAIRSDCGTWMMSDKAGSVSVAREIAVHAMRAMRFDPDDFRKRDAVIAAIGPLLKRCLDSVAAPQEPRGWLTAEERGRLSAFAEYADDHDRRDVACLLRALLARESPPRVRRPQLQDHLLPQAQRDRDDVWIAAIREAGGEVQDG